MLALLFSHASSFVAFQVEDSETYHALQNHTLPATGIVPDTSETGKFTLTIETNCGYISVLSKYYANCVEGKGYLDTRISLTADAPTLNKLCKNITYSGREKGTDKITYTFKYQATEKQVFIDLTVLPEIVEEKPVWETVLLWLGICILALCSGAFSGLNISLLSIDLITLDIMQQCGTPKQKKQASEIAALRTNDNILICTDLFGNTLVNTAMSVLLGETLSPFMGFIISSTVITLVGEILPQTFMYRYQFESSYYLLWFVKFWYVVLFVVSYPLSWFLKLLFGTSSPQKLSRREFAGFIQEQISGEVKYADDEKVIATNALELPDTTVATVACPNDKLSFVNETDIINREFIINLLNTGHSRIPVKNEAGEVSCIILSKNLVYIDSSRNFKVSDVMSFIGIAPKHIPSNTSLYDALKILIKAKTQIAVMDELVDGEDGGDPVKKFAGVVSMTDILSTLFKRDSKPLPKQKQILTQELLTLFSGEECSDAATDWLVQTLLMDKGIPKDAAPVTTVSGSLKYKKVASKGDVIISKGEKTSDLFIVVQGRVQFQNGEENVKSSQIPFAVFGAQTLYDSEKSLNVTVVVSSESCTYLQIPIQELPHLDPNFKE